MKKLSIMFVLLFMSIGVFAQGNMNKKMKTNGEKSVMYAEKMAKEFGLNANQQARIKDAQMTMLDSERNLIAEHKEAATQGTDRMKEESAEMREGRMKIDTDFRANVKGILTADQYVKWETMHDTRMKKNWDKKKKMKSQKMKKMDRKKDETR